MPRGVDLKLLPSQTTTRCRQARFVPPVRAERVMYFVGQGGKDPTAPSCASFRPGSSVPEADCVGFALWALGKDRYEPGVSWWNQNFIYADAAGPRRRWRFCAPYPGCLALVRGPVPGDPRVGHVGIVMSTIGVQADWRVTHCSPRNHLRVGQGVAETTLRQAFGGRAVFFVERVQP